MTKKRFILVTLLFFAFSLFGGFSITTHAQAAVKENSITVYASQITVKENSTYWETSENGGSGRHNKFNKKNPYITNDKKIIINGYSFLDTDGNIIEAKCVLDTKNNIHTPTAPKGTAMTMVHISNKTSPLGWTDESNIKSLLTPANLMGFENADIPKDPEKKTAEEFANSIDEKDGKTLILIDQSYSMHQFVKEATRAFYSIDLTDVTIMAFAEDILKISADEVNKHHDIGALTNIYHALNQANGFQNVVLISDLCDNMGEDLLSFSSVKTLDILCPESYYPSESFNKIRYKWKNVTTSINVIE